MINSDYIELVDTIVSNAEQVLFNTSGAKHIYVENLGGYEAPYIGNLILLEVSYYGIIITLYFLISHKEKPNRFCVRCDTFPASRMRLRRTFKNPTDILNNIILMIKLVDRCIVYDPK